MVAKLTGIHLKISVKTEQWTNTAPKFVHFNVTKWKV